MEPISGVDRLIALLNQRLQVRADRRSGSARPSSARRSDALAAVRALAATADQDPQRFRRALVETILLSRFGDQAINDARFQQIVDRVALALADDDEGLRLLDEAQRELLSRK
ncbi:hypothetical protein [Brevundimonas faecalis]|uniref:Protein kinase n=1 Tax=Brevundimonas faecalis TaxID=947378 RepID=A0ABV2R7M0_9CAUL